MQCYTELTPPTAVTHSLSLPFTSTDSTNLIVAKTSLLQIFTAVTVSVEVESSSENTQNPGFSNDVLDGTIRDGEVADGPLPVDIASRTKLILVAEYTLSGTVTSLVRINTKISKSGADSLLISFKDAKLSLVEWDPERPGLSTISIHYYEQDELQGSPWTPNLSDCVNYLTVDPRNKCAALKFGARSMAILPFKQGDEDINMNEDWDEELDGPRPTSQITNGDSDKTQTPYGSSFVLRLPLLDPSLIYPIHLAFLYEYREPTFGILSSALSPSSSLLHERKDYLSYMVFTLDIDQKESTTILSVSNLPYDLFRIIPLPTPIGGALLIGGNELIHVDQSGKANGVGINMFAKQCTSFGLADQSDLAMRLEGCTIEQLSIENGEMLIILHSGALAILSFRLDGRSVSGISVRRVSTEAGGSIISAGPSSASVIGPSCIFIGSENADSVVLGWNRKLDQLSRRKSKIEVADGIDDEEYEEYDDDDDDDDDLYGDALSTKKTTTNGTTNLANSKTGDYKFELHDSLINIAPMIDVTFSNSAFYQTSEEKANTEGVTSDLQLVGIAGRDRAGALAIVHRNIQPQIIGRFGFPEAQGIWTMSAKGPTPKALQIKDKNDPLSGNFGVEAQYDKLMIVSKAQIDAAEQSDVYALTAAGFEALTGTEFEPAAGSTIEAGTLGNGNRIVQVLRSEVRSYDGGKFTLSSVPSVPNPWQFASIIEGGSFAPMYYVIIRLLAGAPHGNISCPLTSMKALYPHLASRCMPCDVYSRARRQQNVLLIHE